MQTTQQRAHSFHKRRKKQACQRKKHTQRKKRRNRQHQEGRNLMFRFQKTIDHHFPDLYEQIEAIPDCRKRADYSLLELIMAGVVMFVLKKGSRNAMNNEREESRFLDNYERVFRARLPHMDTVADVMEVLEAQHIETLKTELIKGLLAKKILRKYRLLGHFYMVAVDGTHVMDVREGHCDHCLHQTFKNGKPRYFHTVVEAKLIGDNGFCLSLATEWSENPAEYDKQDCELTAFQRLAEKLKRLYPRLPICLVADGLYPNQTFFRICEEQGWAWIVTFKDGNLPSVWERVLQRQALKHVRRREERVRPGNKTLTRQYEWHPHMNYKAFRVHWYSCEEVIAHTGSGKAGEEVIEPKCPRFVYLSSVEMDTYSVLELTAGGRLRWKIENEGFDVQKHHGYGLGHQFSRKSMLAMKNYYQLMQIAHLMNQLFELSSLLAQVRRSKESLAHIGGCLSGELRHEALDFAILETLLARRICIRYD